MQRSAQAWLAAGRKARRFAFVFGIFLHAVLAGAVLAAPPQRIVSLNVCTDQILIDLVPHRRIAAVTHLAQDPLTSAKPERARSLHVVRGSAEEVLALAPDLVLAGQYSTPAAIVLLRRSGLRVETVAQPQSIDGVRASIRHLAALVGEASRGEQMILEMDARIAAVRSASRTTAPVAIVYQVNNYVSAKGSLIDDALRLAGFRNGAATMPIARNGQVGLEALLTTPLDLLVLASGPTTYRTSVADNLRHPALAHLAATRPTVVVPWPLWLCGTHHIAEAVELLAKLP